MSQGLITACPQLQVSVNGEILVAGTVQKTQRTRPAGGLATHPGTPLRTWSVPLSPAGSIRVRITHLGPSLGGSPSPPKGSTQPTLLQAEGGADLRARADQASSHVALWTQASVQGKAFQLTFSKSSFRQISRCSFSCKFLFSTFKRSISSLSSTGRSVS